MIKLFGCVMVVLTCFYTGSMLAEKQHTAFAQTNALVNGLTYMKIQLSTYGSLLSDVFDNIRSKEHTLDDFCYVCIKGIEDGNERFSNIWDGAIDKYSKELKNILCPLGKILGTSPIEDECAAIDDAVFQLKRLCDVYLKDYYEKKKLFSRLGLLCGTFIAILLI